jgi:hypothetical protein
VQEFDSAGTYLSQFGSLGTTPGQLNGPNGVALGPNGTVYVADYNNNRVERFGRLPVLTSTLAGEGKGRVSGPLISCPSRCVSASAPGAQVTLTAAPEPDSYFAGWSGACTGTGACVVTMSENQTVTATFGPDVGLYATLGGNGHGHVSGPDISCPSQCSGKYAPGTQVPLTATPDAKSYFAGWSGACTGTGTCVVTLSENQAVTASFNWITAADTKILKATIDRKHHRAKFTFQAIGRATNFQCALVKNKKRKKGKKAPAPKFSSCTTPKTYTKLKAGKYSFLVRVLNVAGPDRSPAKKNFKV